LRKQPTRRSTGSAIFELYFLGSAQTRTRSLLWGGEKAKDVFVEMMGEIPAGLLRRVWIATE
jgi:hypothetical protein